jgi:hypothetical protein
MWVQLTGSPKRGTGLTDRVAGCLNDWITGQTNCPIDKMKVYLIQGFTVKGKSHHISCHEGQRGSRSITSSTSALDGGGCSKLRPGRFTPGN